MCSHHEQSNSDASFEVLINQTNDKPTLFSGISNMNLNDLSIIEVHYSIRRTNNLE